MKAGCPAEADAVVCHRCGRKVESVRVSASRPRDHRCGHHGPICARCWLQDNLASLRLGPNPVAAPGAPRPGAFITAREAREMLGIPPEALYAGTALGLIHPVRADRPSGRRTRMKQRT